MIFPDTLCDIWCLVAISEQPVSNSADIQRAFIANAYIHLKQHPSKQTGMSQISTSRWIMEQSDVSVSRARAGMCCMNTMQAGFNFSSQQDHKRHAESFITAAPSQSHYWLKKGFSIWRHNCKKHANTTRDITACTGCYKNMWRVDRSTVCCSLLLFAAAKLTFCMFFHLLTK